VGLSYRSVASWRSDCNLPDVTAIRERLNLTQKKYSNRNVFEYTDLFRDNPVADACGVRPLPQ
jgi:hypothetical protein